MRKLIATVAAVASLFAVALTAGAAPSSAQSAPTLTAPAPPAAIVTAEQAPADPQPIRVTATCEDSDAVPCVSVGDAPMWVTSWEPLTAVDLADCPTEDGGPVPCVWAAHLQGQSRSDLPLFLVYL